MKKFRLALTGIIGVVLASIAAGSVSAAPLVGTFTVTYLNCKDIPYTFSNPLSLVAKDDFESTGAITNGRSLAEIDPHLFRNLGTNNPVTVRATPGPNNSIMVDLNFAADPYAKFTADDAGTINKFSIQSVAGCVDGTLDRSYLEFVRQ